MKILVCISVVPDTTAPVRFVDDNTRFDDTGVNFIMNPYDEWYALSRAVELIEENGGELVAIHVGPDRNNSIVQKALAIGASSSVRINSEALSAKQVAFEIASFAKDKSFDLILTGKETIDHSGALVGGMLAGMLDFPFVSFATKLDIDGSKARLHREIEGGHEVVSSDLPLVVSAAKGIAEQRIPNMRGIMMAKKKPQEVIEPKDFSTQSGVLRYEIPEGNAGVKMIDPNNMEELVRLLKEEAKVL